MFNPKVLQLVIILIPYETQQDDSVPVNTLDLIPAVDRRTVTVVFESC